MPARPKGVTARLRTYRLPIGINPSLLHYQRSWLGPDISAGITVGALTIPSALGYAEVAGLPPVFGLYAAMVPMVVFALFGSSRHLVLGPDGAFAALIGASLGPVSGFNPQRAVILAPVLGLLVGALFLLFGLLRVGFLASFLSKPLLSGFMTGLAVTILVGQLPKVLGIKVSADSVVGKVIEMIRERGDIRWWSVVLGGTTVALALLLGRVQPRLPSAVLLLLVGAGLVAVFALERHGIAVVGDIPTGLPPIDVPDVTPADVSALLPGALALAVVGFADAVLQSRRYAEEARYETDPNRDLVGLGVANLAGSFASGYPVGASASRSSAALAGGGRSSLTSIVGAVVIALVLLVFAPVIEHMPVPVLAGVVIAAALRLMCWGEITALWADHRAEWIVAVAALVGVVLTGVLVGVAVALAISLVDFVRRAATPHDAVLGRRADRPGWHDVLRTPTTMVPGLLVYRFDAPLFFGNAQAFRERIQTLVANSDPPPRWLLVHASAISEVDVTAREVLQRLIAELDEQGIAVAVSGAHARMRRRMRETEIPLVPPERVFATIDQAVAAFEAEQDSRN